MGKFINKFCKACNIEEPKHEKVDELIMCIATAWAIILLGYFTMWLVYGG